MDPIEDLSGAVSPIAREFAKLDGFDVTLRSVKVSPELDALRVSKHWVVPVRVIARNEEWRSPDGEAVGSHDAAGNVRSEYLQFIETEGLYEKNGRLKEGLLDPDCIEAWDWDLSAGKYKPVDFAQLRSEKSLTELIASLQETEMRILQSLNNLKATVEGRE